MAQWAAPGADGRRASPLALVATALWAPIAAMLVQMAISRTRVPPTAGAELCRDPLALASALEVIDQTQHAATRSAAWCKPTRAPAIS